MKKSILLIFGITIIVSIFVFIKYDGYKGMFDFLKTEQIEVDTSKIEFEVLPMVEPAPDTVSIYYVIIGSFKNYENAVNYSQNYDFSDILPITENGFYMVTKDYFFNIEDAIEERNKIGNDSWVLKDKFIFGN